MNNNTTSQFMDKQIMDLSNSQSTSTANNNSSSNNDFIDFMNRPSEKKEDIVPSYDFMPINPGVGSSSPPMNRLSNFDSAEENAPLRTWNSFDSKTNVSSSRNYGSLDVDEPAKFILGKNHKPSNASLDVSLVSEIDMTVKKYTDNLMHAMDGVSARLSQLETRTRNLENSMDDLKLSIGNNHGSSDGKMRQMENILREVQTGVHVIRDKQEIVEAQLQTAKLQFPKEQVESQKTAHTELSRPGASDHQQFSTVSLTQPPPTLPPPNAPPPPSPQQTLQPQIQFPNQFPQNQIISVPQQESYFSPSGQTPENPNQQYQIPPPHQHQHQHQHHSMPPPPQHQYQPPPSSQPQYSQPPPSSQPHPSFSTVNPSLPQAPLGHHPEESPYSAPQTYPLGIHPPPPLHPPTGVPPPPSQQFYGPTRNAYEPQSSRPGPGYSNSFGQSSSPGEPYPYSSSPSQYGSGSPMKSQQLSSSAMGQSGGSGYPQLPTARILPQALPTATAVGGGSGSGSGGSGNKVPIDDVVDKVTHMGFSRDQVRATVRKLTENGQAVDLNVVLDKLMNDGDGQAPRGWLGR